MRVVDRKTFLQLPPGTMYCKGVQWAFDDLQVKCQSLMFGDDGRGDWVYRDFNQVDSNDSGEQVDRLDEMLAKGVSYPMEVGASRDGFFDQDAVFLIFEKADLMEVRKCIDAALALPVEIDGTLASPAIAKSANPA